MYISKKILELLYSVRKFIGQDDRAVYCMIKQEIKYNPKYKNVRFMSEQKFYEVLEIGKYYAHQENYDKKYYNIIDLYYCVRRIQNVFIYKCYQKWYETVLNDELFLINLDIFIKLRYDKYIIHIQIFKEFT